MSQIKVIVPDAIENIDRTSIGAKAFCLVQMNQIGLAVPPGFCITEGAFTEHLETNNLVSQIESVLDKLNSVSPEDRKSILSEIRQAIIDAPLAGELRNEIENHYRALAADRVAVRSSATAEDLPGHSFAGQYETYLGVVDLAGCIDAVKKCWASLWTKRAYDYRQNNGFDHLAVKMAVIVQSLIEADASGVIFTADPVNGYKSRIIIETVPGLGDTLVSGKATPQRFVVAKKKCRIVSKNLISESCLTDSVVKRLAKLGKKVEKHFNSPQDIEWAISDNKIFFLQSRPITAVPQKKSWEERQVWTNAAFRDVAPDVLTPATWSLMEQFIEPLFGPLFKLIAVNIGNNPIGGLVAGRVYLNINTFMAIFQNLPDSFHTAITRSFGGQHQKQFDRGHLDIPPEDLPDIKLNLLKTLFYFPRSIYMLYKHRSSKAHALLERLTEINKINGMRNLSEMNQVQLIKSLLETIETELHQMDILYFFTTLSYLPMVQWFCKRWLGDESDQLTNLLSAGTGEMQDVQAGIALWEIAQKATADSVLKEIVLIADNWSTLHLVLKKTESGRDFLKSWNEFMAQHGHHCRGEILLFNPRWYETPDYILSIVKSYIEANGIHNPASDLKQKITQRQHLLKTTLNKFRNPIKRILLRHAVMKTRKGLMFRENVKSEIVRFISSGREALLELGQKLTVDQTLEKCDDIFFLQFDELAAIADKKVDFDIHQTIKNRRLKYEKYKSLTPPEIVIGRFDPDTYVPEEIDTQVTVLKGTSTCPGIVKGPARVILRADENQHVQPGEILVAPFTDPGWTPYFLNSAGIVMDQGGMLSHGSIIAREYGIPAVVNVGPATKIIKTGQTIQVDANHGIVKIIR